MGSNSLATKGSLDWSNCTSKGGKNQIVVDSESILGQYRLKAWADSNRPAAEGSDEEFTHRESTK
jgi:hypothetical protein